MIKTKKTILGILFIIPLFAISQVGVNTTSPTATLDVNGTARVRSFTQQGTVETDASGNLSVNPVKVVALGKVADTGIALKISGATVTRLSLGNYRVTFSAPRPDDNYIIMLAQLETPGDIGNDDVSISYFNQTVNGFDVLVGNNDNGGTSREASTIDLEFSFVVYDIF